MADVNVTPLGGRSFRVEVQEGSSKTTHEVTVVPETLTRLGWSGTTEELIRRSFEFLLARESKESILRQFDLSVISRYFPEYEDAARRGFR